MKQIFWVFLLGIFSGLAPYVPEEKVATHKVTFKIKNAGITVDGSFSNVDAKIDFDTKDLKKSVLRGSVEVASISTGIGMRDRDLLARKYFYAEKYPRINMVSKQIKSLGKDRFTGTFDLTIRDVTKEIEVPFTHNRKENRDVLKGEFSVNRRDFGVGSNSIFLSDNVTIIIDVTTE